jgi:hypothetical protein
MTPSMWLGGAVAGCLALFAAGVTIKHRTQLADAVETGKAIGTGEASTAAVTAATETATALREAEAETPLPVDKQAILDLCKRRASCRERGAIK